MAERPILLIGPAAVGKSTVGTELAGLLRRPFVDLDEVAAEYYREVGQDVERLVERIGSHGLIEAHRWWQPARVHAVRRCLSDHAEAVVALGAGHSHFEDVEHVDAVREAVAPAIVVLLRPYPDDDASEAFLADRCRAERGEDWGGAGFLVDWVRSTQNRDLATIDVLVAGRSPGEIAADITERLRLLTSE